MLAKKKTKVGVSLSIGRRCAPGTPKEASDFSKERREGRLRETARKGRGETSTQSNFPATKGNNKGANLAKVLHLNTKKKRRNGYGREHASGERLISQEAVSIVLGRMPTYLEGLY